MSNICEHNCESLV